MSMATLTHSLSAFFERDLNRIIEELKLYQSEANIWRIEKGISNAAGNLVLHLIGNLNTYIGKEIGGTNYVRNRPLEFSQKDVTRQVLIQQLSETIVVVTRTIISLTEDDLKKEYPMLVLEKATSTEYFMLHLLSHLSYHLGQINYHRRMIDV